MTSEEKTNLKKLYIRNLAFEVEQDDIRDAFQEFGEIVRCDVPIEKPGKCKGYAFVEFRSEESAKMALDEKNNQEVKGRRITINFAVDKINNRRFGDGDRGGYNKDRPPYQKRDDYPDSGHRREYDSHRGGYSSRGGSRFEEQPRSQNRYSRDDNGEFIKQSYQVSNAERSPSDYPRAGGYHQGSDSSRRGGQDYNRDQGKKRDQNETIRMIEEVSSQRDIDRSIAKKSNFSDAPVDYKSTNAQIITEIQTFNPIDQQANQLRSQYDGQRVGDKIDQTPVYTQQLIASTQENIQAKSKDLLPPATGYNQYGQSVNTQQSPIDQSSSIVQQRYERSNMQSQHSGDTHNRRDDRYDRGSPKRHYERRPDDRIHKSRSRDRSRDRSRNRSYEKRDYGRSNNADSRRSAGFSEKPQSYGRGSRDDYASRGGAADQRKDYSRPHGDSNREQGSRDFRDNRRFEDRPARGSGDDRPSRGSGYDRHNDYQAKSYSDRRHESPRSSPKHHSPRGGFQDRRMNSGYQQQDSGDRYPPRGGQEGGYRGRGNYERGSYGDRGGFRGRGDRGDRGDRGRGGFRGGRGGYRGRGAPEDDVPEKHSFDEEKARQAALQFQSLSAISYDTGNSYAQTPGYGSYDTYGGYQTNYNYQQQQPKPTQGSGVATINYDSVYKTMTESNRSDTLNPQ